MGRRWYCVYARFSKYSLHTGTDVFRYSEMESFFNSDLFPINILKTLRKVGTERWNLANASTGFISGNCFCKTTFYLKKCSQICANVTSLPLTEQNLVPAFNFLDGCTYKERICWIWHVCAGWSVLKSPKKSP